MEEKTNMTAERSLEIIRQSIENSQRTITKNSSLSLTWWGLCVVVFSLIIAYLWQNHGGPVWNWLWAVMWGIGYLGNRAIDMRKEKIPSTFVGKTIGNVWGTFGIFCGGLGLILGLIGTGVIPASKVLPDSANMHLYLNITSIISLCFGIASTITGLILKNRIIQICGLIAGFGGFFGALHYPWAEQLYVMAAVAFIGLIVPGLLIYFQNKK
jgi:hypothetical protein